MINANQSVQIRVAADVGNLGVLRALVSATAVFEDLSADAVADLRLALDEAATQLIRCAQPAATLLVTVDPQPDTLILRASVAATRDAQVVEPGSFSWHVLQSLADVVETFTAADEPGHNQGISLTMRRWSDAS